MRLIDADALKLRIDMHGTNKFGMLDEDIRQFVDDAPTADVPDRKVGKWVDAKPMSGKVGKVCSACGDEAYWDSDYGQQLFSFCPNCGAEMQKER